MPLVTSKELLLDAQARGYAVGAFNANNMECVKAVIEAAEEERAPVILQVSQGAIKYAGLKMATAMVATIAAEASVPVVLHLDHGTSFSQNIQCLHVGFSSLTANVMFLVIGPLASILGARAWGRAVDRWGRQPVLVISTAVTIFSVVPWFFATSSTGSGLAAALHLPAGTPVGSYLLGGLACAVGGFSWTGLALAQQGIWFGFTDGPGKSRYVAAYDILTGLGGAVGALVGGLVAQDLAFLERAPILLGPLLWNNWHVTFALSMISRVVSTALAMRIPDPGSADTWTVVRAIRVNVYNTMATWLVSPLRVLMPRRWHDKDDQAGDSAV